MEGNKWELGLAFGSWRVYPRFLGLHVRCLGLSVERGHLCDVGSPNGNLVGTTNVVKQHACNGNKEK